jgi:hypothetical protein
VAVSATNLDFEFLEPAGFPIKYTRTIVVAQI